MVMHKAKGHVEPYGLDRLVDEFEVESEEEESQTLFNSSAADGEEPHLDIGEESDTTPSQADASASMKCQIERELKEAVAIPSNHASIPPQSMVTPAKFDQTKSFLSSTPSQYNQAKPTEFQKIASLQHSQTPPDTATRLRFFNPVIIMDSDGDWTVGGQETPKFKSKAGKERKLKKPMQVEQNNMFSSKTSLGRKEQGVLEQDNMFSSKTSLERKGLGELDEDNMFSSKGRKDQGEPPSITPTQQSSGSNVPKCVMDTPASGSGVMDTPVRGSDKAQPTTSPLPKCVMDTPASGSDKTQPTTSSLPLAAESQYASGFFTPVQFKTGMRSKQEPEHLNTPREIKVSPKEMKEAEAKKVRKDILPPLKTDELLQR